MPKFKERIGWISRNEKKLNLNENYESNDV